MANSLTGDYEAVMQISGATLNRLLASLHQNALTYPGMTNFTHSAVFRVGDPTPIDGVQGTAWAQIAVPRVELIDGSQDRFILHLWFRARYVPDHNSQDLPEFINGSVRAQYELAPVDPNSPGFEGMAADFVWPRVVADTIEVNVTALDDPRGGLLPFPDPNTDERIKTVVTVLMKTQFAAAPYRVGKQFRRGSMASLNHGGGGSVVVVPFGITGDPRGQIGSVQNILVESKDFAVAVATATVMAPVEAALAAIRKLDIKTHVVGTFAGVISADTWYDTTVDDARAQWQPNGSFATLKIHLHGTSHTNSILPDASFTVDQDIVIGFDAKQGNLTIVPGTLTVDVHSSGPLGGTIESRVHDEVTTQVQSSVAGMCADAQRALNDLTAQNKILTNQLRTFDAEAYTRFDRAEFSADGVTLLGRVQLADRWGGVAEFDKEDQAGEFDALKSWLPGGRIDKFTWTWVWSWIRPASGTESFDDRFVLRRPSAGLTRFGRAKLSLSQGESAVLRPLPDEPSNDLTVVQFPFPTGLPGLDGEGLVCLEIEGVQVDPVSGDFMPVKVQKWCLNYGYIFQGGDRVLPKLPILAQRAGLTKPGGGPVELGLKASGPGESTVSPSNVLMVHVGKAWSKEIAVTLRSGLEACKCDDAGLLALLLLPQGALESGRSQLLSQLSDLTATLPAPLVVSEDSYGDWANSLHAPRSGAPAWRLFDPQGRITWVYDGQPDGQTLGQGLTSSLLPSSAAGWSSLTPSEAARVGETRWIAPILQPMHVSRWPPVPLSAQDGKDSTLSFVDMRSAASRAELERLVAESAQAGKDRPLRVVIMEGASAEEQAALQEQLGQGFTAIADPKGEVARTFGLRIWPTTVTLGGRGGVTGWQLGAPTRPAAKAPTD